MNNKQYLEMLETIERIICDIRGNFKEDPLDSAFLLGALGYTITHQIDLLKKEIHDTERNA